MCDALYIHIPFCERKCPYCDFYSVAADEALMDAYTDAAIRSIGRAPYALAPLDTRLFRRRHPFGTGGPPPFAHPRGGGCALWDRVGRGDYRRVQPPLGTWAGAFHPAGGGRQPPFVRDAERRRRPAPAARAAAHRPPDVVSAVETARGCGFAHFSLDLMLATPGQTPADIDRAVGLCGRLGAEHVSAYLLQDRAGHPL